MSKTISFRLNTSSVEKAVKEVREYQKWVEEKTKELTKRLAEVGLEVASVGFSGAKYDGDNDAVVTIEETPKGFTVLASGTAVAFIEFGAGVHYNGAAGTSPHPQGAEMGAIIGEYGYGLGKNDSWSYTDSTGKRVTTHGTPAEMPMYHAARKMEREYLRIAREVFRQ